ncbi:MAG: PDZ domain-containing protein [Puniceicoccaceae bacterium]
MKIYIKSISLSFAVALSSMLPVQFIIADASTPRPEVDAPEPPAPPAPPRRAFLGVVTEKVPASTVAQMGLTPGIGLNVESVVKGSAADRAGVMAYDILLEMDGQWLTSVSHLSTLLSMKKPGETAAFRLLRKGEELAIQVELGSKPTAHPQKSWEWEFEEKMEELGRRLESIAENEEIMEHVRERIDAEEIEQNVRSALEKARYQIRQWVSDDGSRTSIVHTGNARSIVNTDDGTLIFERLSDGKSRVIAINRKDEVLFNGVISDSAELDGLEPWVAREYGKLQNHHIEVEVTEAITLDTSEKEK